MHRNSNIKIKMDVWDRIWEDWKYVELVQDCADLQALLLAVVDIWILLLNMISAPY
jgi:hypothetical protein